MIVTKQISMLILSVNFLFFTVRVLGEEIPLSKIPMKTNASPVKMPVLPKIDIEKEIAQLDGFEKRYATLLKNFRTKQADDDLNKLISLLEDQWETLYPLSCSLLRIREKKIQENVRQSIMSNWLIFYKSMDDIVDKESDFSEKPFINLSPIPDDWPEEKIRAIDEPLMSGMAPEYIKNPEIRKNYEERLAKNAAYAKEYRLQQFLKKQISLTINECTTFASQAYSITPKADDELIALLKKYDYPEAEQHKIFKAHNIPIDGFRVWQSADGLLKVTAKIVAINADAVKLESEKGDTLNVELHKLRKEDQEHVKLQNEMEAAKTQSP